MKKDGQFFLIGVTVLFAGFLLGMLVGRGIVQEPVIIQPVTAEPTLSGESLAPTENKSAGISSTGKINILKHMAGDETRVLAGAEFQLYKLVTEAQASDDAITMTYNGVEVILEPTAIVLTTDENGQAVTPELPFGLYFLVETKAPIGYVALNEPIPAWVTETSVSAAYTIKIPNTPIFELPETGGAGTTLFTVIGSLILVFGVVLLIRRRRNSAE